MQKFELILGVYDWISSRQVIPSKLTAINLFSTFTMLLLLLAYPAEAQLVIDVGDDRYSLACSRLLGLVEGSFGALLTVAAGLGAIVASAVGGFKAAWALLVVSVASFILRSYVTLFFAACGGVFCLECV